MNDIGIPAHLSRLNQATPELIARLSQIVGPEHALTDPDQQQPYLKEWRDMYTGVTPVVLRPGSTAEVSQILAVCNEARVAVVPQSGNTGLVGAQTPHESGREIAITLERMKAVREVDAAGYSMTVETGLTLAEAQAVAEKAGRFFPLALPSQGSCRIGGNLGTNAGGVGVLAYGNTRQLVLGLEVVLADGRVVNNLKALKKDNTGYDLRDLFIGSEGTLGIMTAAVLRLFPKPAETVTAIVALPSLDHAIALFALAQDAAGRSLTAFEFMPRFVIDVVTRHVAGAREPFDNKYDWHVLLEITGLKADGTSAVLMEGILTDAVEKGVVIDANIAASLNQAADFWKLRESISEAQKYEGGSIKHDVSVPVARIPEFVTRATKAALAICPGARPLAVGHFGDGNVHYNICQPVGMDKAEFLKLWSPIMEAVHAIVADMNGSISAEHGIGRMKREELAHFKSPVELELMRGIKKVFDPNGILSPGRVI